MTERSRLIEWIRGELVGPSRPLDGTGCHEFSGNEFVDPIALRSGPLAWRPNPNADLQEVLYFERETPHRKYGAGLCTLEHSSHLRLQIRRHMRLTLSALSQKQMRFKKRRRGARRTQMRNDPPDPSDEFEVTSPDIRHPSTIGISFCVRLNAKGRIVVLPPKKRLFWQGEVSLIFHLMVDMNDALDGGPTTRETRRTPRCGGDCPQSARIQP